VACGRHLRAVVGREGCGIAPVASGDVLCRCLVAAAGHKREAAIEACGGHQRRSCAVSLYKMYEKYRKYAGGVVLWLWPGALRAFLVACGFAHACGFGPLV
jgi:hypothetical protein